MVGLFQQGLESHTGHLICKTENVSPLKNILTSESWLCKAAFVLLQKCLQPSDDSTLYSSWSFTSSVYIQCVILNLLVIMTTDYYLHYILASVTQIRYVIKKNIFFVNLFQLISAQSDDQADPGSGVKRRSSRVLDLKRKITYH